jgi:hypothetical protein
LAVLAEVLVVLPIFLQVNSLFDLNDFSRLPFGLLY